MKAYLMRAYRKISLGLSFIVLIMAFLIVIFWNSMVHTIPVGHSGVRWHRIFMEGTMGSTGPLAEGLQITLPWDKIYTYDLRLLSQEQSYQVLSQDGLAFQLDLNFRWHVSKDNLVHLNQTFGPNYINTLMIQEVGSITREIAAQYSVDALFTNARTNVQQKIYDRVTEITHPNGIGVRPAPGEKSDNVVILNDILILKVMLPKRIVAAIENKLEQAQMVEEYAYRVEREALESDRKRVEAEGIRSFQEIVTPAISESYLRWRGIEATLALAQSPNSKVVVIGNSTTGLPLILDTTTAPLNGEPQTSTLHQELPTITQEQTFQRDQGNLNLIHTGDVNNVPWQGTASAPQVTLKPSSTMTGALGDEKALSNNK